MTKPWKRVIACVLCMLMTLSEFSLGEFAAISSMIVYAANAAPIAGDINGDGTINNKDLTRLMKYLAGDNVTIY